MVASVACVSRGITIAAVVGVWLAGCGFDSDTVAADGAPPSLQGRVVHVRDGDSLTLLVDGSEIHVRLAQIDAPELDQPYGLDSRAALAAMVADATVRAEVIELDRYGRSVAEVYRDGRHINREMVEQGHAWAYTRYARSIQVIELEDAARAAQRGLWKLPESQRDAPWVWRHSGVHSSPATPSEAFVCGAKRHCREMTSCAEARFHLNQCGLAIDGDRDGIPCEAICTR